MQLLPLPIVNARVSLDHQESSEEPSHMRK